MARVKKGTIFALSVGLLLVLIIFAAFSSYGSTSEAEKSKITQNPYISTAAIVKIPVAPIVGTQEESGYKLVIVDGFTSTESHYTLTNTYDSTTVSGVKEIIVGTMTTKIAENANFDENSDVWSVYRTTMGMSENKVVSFTTMNYEPLFDVLQYYYKSPHYITLHIGEYTTPIILIYGEGMMTVYLEPTAIIYEHALTYTTTIDNKVYTIVNVMTGHYTLEDAKFATEILPQN